MSFWLLLLVLVFDRIIPPGREPGFPKGSQWRPVLSSWGQYGLQSLPPDVEDYIDRLKAPLLIMQGASEPRVPAGEAIQVPLLVGDGVAGMALLVRRSAGRFDAPEHAAAAVRQLLGKATS